MDSQASAGRVEGSKKVAQNLHLVRTTSGFHPVAVFPDSMTPEQLMREEAAVAVTGDLTVGTFQRVRLTGAAGEVLPESASYAHIGSYYFALYRVIVPLEEVQRYVRRRR